MIHTYLIVFVCLFAMAMEICLRWRWKFVCDGDGDSFAMAMEIRLRWRWRFVCDGVLFELSINKHYWFDIKRVADIFVFHILDQGESVLRNRPYY